MTNPYREMCSELVAASYRVIASDYVCWENNLWEVADRARALLAQPVAEGPTDEAIMELMPQQMRDDLAAAASALACGLDITGLERDSMKAVGVCRTILNRHAVDHAHAVLARWGRPTPQSPAAGEVAELVAWLRKTGKFLHPDYSSSQVPYMRVADLLQRLESDNAGLTAAAESLYLDNISLLDN